MKKNLKSILLPLLMGCVTLSAYPANDTIIIRNDDSTELIERDLDSLLNNWFVKMSVTGASFVASDSIITEFSDSVYVDRIGRINAVIDLP